MAGDDENYIKNSILPLNQEQKTQNDIKKSENEKNKYRFNSNYSHSLPINNQIFKKNFLIKFLDFVFRQKCLIAHKLAFGRF